MNAEQVLDYYFKSNRLGSKPYTERTQGNYRQNCSEFEDFISRVHPDLEPAIFTDATEKHILAYYDKLKERGILDSSIGTKMSCLKAVYGCLFMRRMIQVHPLPQHIQRGSSGALFLPKFLSFTETNHVLQSAVLLAREKRLPNYYDVNHVLWAIGFRREELITQVKPENYDSQSKVLTIIGKGLVQRSIPLRDLPLQSALAIHIIEDRFDRTPTRKNAFPYDVSWINKIVTRTALWAALPKDKALHPHTWRHTFATHLLSLTQTEEYRGKYPLENIAAYLGHTSVDMTRRYAKVPTSALIYDLQRARAFGFNLNREDYPSADLKKKRRR